MSKILQKHQFIIIDVIICIQTLIRYQTIIKQSNYFKNQYMGIQSRSFNSLSSPKSKL